MIDWLDEVLRGAQSEEERNWLAQLLGQSIVPTVGRVRGEAEETEPQKGLSTGSGDGLDSGQMALPAYSDERGKAVLAGLVQKAIGHAFPESAGMIAGEDFTAVLPGNLYRRTTEALRSRLAAEMGGTPAVVREEQAANTGLTARELDRAVRRDSRRYDGGMNIY